jgi:hypothetical protein
MRKIIYPPLTSKKNKSYILGGRDRDGSQKRKYKYDEQEPVSI